MSNKSYDAVIIGAGIIGAAVGLELTRKGYKTLNIDRLPAAGYGPTGASCAIIRTHYSTLDGSAIAYESYFYWKDWAAYLGIEDERGLAEFHECGCLVMKTPTNHFMSKILGHMDALGVPYEEWDADQITARLPFYDLRQFAPVRRPEDPGFGVPSEERLSGAVFFPCAGYISDPQLATHNVQRAAEAQGGAFLFNRGVVGITRDGGRVGGVTLDDGETVAAPVVVNVAGPHSAAINRLAGVDHDMTITTKALKQEVVHVPAPKGVDYGRAGFVTSDGDIGCYTRPEVGNHILIGSEDPECDPREWVDPDGYDQDFSEQWTVQAYRLAQRIPSLGIPSRRRGVVSLYDVSDDWIPIYDKSALPGFYMAIGTSGNQFKNAPVAGQMMATLIDACEHGRDHDAEPVDISLVHTGRTIDIGFFSRKRQINADSSFSVLG